MPGGEPRASAPLVKMAKIKVPTIVYARPRWAHQAEGEKRLIQAYLIARRLKAPFGYGLFHDPGCGKTLTTINFLRRLTLLERQFFRILILGPPIVVPNWREEILKFSKFNPRTVHALLGDGAQRLNRFQQAAFDHNGSPLPGVFILNYESTVGKAGTNLGKLYNSINRWAPEVIVLDESQRLKNHSALRSQRVEQLCNPSDPKIKKLVPRPGVILLSGTPVLNSPLDIFQQYLCLDGGATFGSNFYEFRAKFFRDKNARMRGKHFPKWVPKPGTLDRLQNLIAQKSMRALKAQCMDLPPMVSTNIALEMSPTQRKHYDEMKRHLITYLEDDACVAQLAITKSLRLLQIASGYLKTEDGTEVSFNDNPKAQATQELLEDLAPSHKVIIWAVFKENYKTLRAICQRMDLPFREIHGEISPKNKKKAEDDFQKDPKVRVMIGHPRAGGIGINLTASSQTIRYSSDYSLEDYIQSRDRNHRGGSEIHESITQRNLVMAGTIEEKVIECLDEKKQIGVNLLRELV